MTKRVVVTGLGAVTPVGNNVADIWSNLLKGKSGIGAITLFDASELGTRFGGEVKEFDPVALFGRKEARRMDRFTQFSMEASRQAIEDAGITAKNINRTRVGPVIGSGLGGMNTFYSNMIFSKRAGLAASVHSSSQWFCPIRPPRVWPLSTAIKGLQYP